MSLNASSQGASVIVAPHADDEVVGCGGWLLKQHALGLACRVVVLTASSPDRLAERNAVLNTLGVASVVDLGLPEMQNWTDGAVSSAAARLAGVIDDCDAAFLFVPNRRDPHRDHLHSHALTAAALDKLGNCRADVLEYEGLVPLPDPNAWLNITAFAEQKRKALADYGSQDRKYRLSETILHLNAYRGHTMMRRSISHAEMYRRQDIGEYLQCAGARDF